MLNRTAVSTVVSPVVENLDERKLMTAVYDIGINANDGSSASFAKAAPTLKALGVKSVRLWTTVSDFNDHSWNGVLSRAEDYSNAGFDVTMEVSTKNGKVPSYSAVQGWFNWAVGNTALKNAVDRWEIGNEPDHSNYWNGSLSAYVNDYLKPAYETLHAAGETVVSAGPSWNPADVQTMINAGMLNYTDYVGFHPYATGVSGVEKDVAAIDAVVDGRKPIAFTEWNVRGSEGDKANWAKEVAEVFPAIKAGSALNYYFAMKVMNSKAGPGGIFTTSYGHNTDFFNAFSTFDDAAGSTDTGYTYGASTGGSTGGSTTGGTTSGGNTASGTGTITGTLFNDLNADGKYDAGDTFTSPRVVFIDANGNGKLDAGEKTVTSNASGVYTFNGLGKGSYKISRVFPSGYKIANSSTADVTATIAAGQKVSGVNIGSVATTAATTPAKPTTPSAPTTPTSSSSSPTVTGIQIFNAATGKLIATYASGATVTLSSLPTKNIAIAAAVTGNVGSVKLSGFGKTVTENNAPYSLLGDSNGDYTAWAAVKGTYTFAATAYSADNAGGTKGKTLSVTLTLK